MEILAGIGLFFMGYKFRQNTSKEKSQKERHFEEIKEKQIKLKETVVALEDTKNALKETRKQYVDITVRLTKTRIITVTVAAGLVAAAYITYKAWKLKKLAEEKSERILSMDNAWQCVVCEENEKEIVYVPCNHLAICRQCDIDLSKLNRDENRKDTCPICRIEITNRLKVYAQ